MVAIDGHGLGISSSHDYIFFFFFQAEDGIRDYKVTGVQTCALPISLDLLRLRNARRRTDRLAQRSKYLLPPMLAGKWRRSRERTYGRPSGWIRLAMKVRDRRHPS